MFQNYQDKKDNKMFREHIVTEDLKCEIQYLKKNHLNVTLENNTLKVKVRKLEKELTERNKMIENLLDPQKSYTFRRAICENGADLLLSLKNKNEHLEKSIKEKDFLINKLQNQIETTKLYMNSTCSTHQKNIFTNCSKSKSDLRVENNSNSNNNNNQAKLDCATAKIISISSSNKYASKMFEDSPTTSTARTIDELASVGMADDSSARTSPSNDEYSVVTEKALSDIEKLKVSNTSNQKDKIMKTVDFKDQFRDLSRQHLLSIIESLKSNNRHGNTSPRKSYNSSPASELESPHEEVQHLQRYFFEILDEVDGLKNTINQLKDDQKNTEWILSKKNKGIQKLAEEIKILKLRKHQPRRVPSSAFTTTTKKIRQTSGKFSENSSSEQSSRPSSSSSYIARKHNVSLHSSSSKEGSISSEVSKEANSECPYYNTYDIFRKPFKSQLLRKCKSPNISQILSPTPSVQSTIEEQDENDYTTTVDEESVPVL